MTRILKILFGIILLILVIGLIILMFLQEEWLWWVRIMIFLGIVGLWVGFIFLRKFLAIRKMRKFVSRVVEQDTPSNLPEDDLNKHNSTKTLKKRWKDAINLIKMSKAEEVPWFLLLGGRDSGKSSAIKHAKLSTDLSSITKNTGISHTENCEWWFLEKSIILDTTSRYVNPTNETRDTEEWIEFLQLFVKYRKRNSLNGIIVTISVEQLLTGNSMSLWDEGQNIRKRIDNLMRVSWAKFPVYIMITKADQLYGFSDTFAKFTKEELDQAAGYLNYEGHDWNNVIEGFFEEAILKLCNLRKRVVSESNKSPAPGIMILPQEFLKLKSALIEFSKPIFGNNSYQEQPLCRGIYFSSAKHGNIAKSSIIKDGNDYISNQLNENLDNGLFLRDFFDKVLPDDSYLVEPAYNKLRWKYTTRSLQTLYILSFAAILSSLYTVAYIHNRNVINQFLNEFPTSPYMTDDIISNLIMLDNFQRNIHLLASNDEHWILPSLGLTTSQDFVKRLKAQYVNLYNKSFLDSFDSKLYERITNLDESDDIDEASLYMGFLAARIDTIDQQLLNHNKTNDATINHNLAAIFPRVATEIYSQLPASVANITDDNYIAYLSWNQDQNAIKRNLKVMLKMVNEILIDDPDWSVIKDQNVFISQNNINLSDFWGNSNLNTNKDGTFVPGMFTKEGMGKVKRFIELVTQSEEVQGDDIPKLQKFWDWYQVEYFEAWRKFILNFNQVNISSFNFDERKSLAASMVTENNPYQKLITVANHQLSLNEHLTNQPEWANLIIELNNLQNISSSRSTIMNLQKKLFQGVNKVSSDKSIKEKSAYFNKEVQAVNLLNDYNNALSQVSPVLISDEANLRYASQIFAEYNGTADPKSPITIAVAKFNQLQELLNNNDDSTMVWQVMGGQLSFLIKYFMDNAACAIDNKWSNEVVGKLANVRSNDVPKILLDKNNGLLWKFVSDTLNPFLSLEKTGYSGKLIYQDTAFAQSVHFNSIFLDFINNASPNMVDYQSQYAINMATIPITVNNDANTKPYGVILTVQCSDGEQVLNNYNYPNQAVINWSPDKCGDTKLTILFSGLTLTKTYPGAMGFAKFIADFKAGSHQFNSSDFAESDVLKNDYNIDWIEIKYKIDSNASLLNSLSGNLPESITYCSLKSAN